MEGVSRLPVRIVAVMVVLVAMTTANLTGFGIGSAPLLYDTIALPRLVIAVVLTLAAWTAWFALVARRGEALRVDVAWALLGALALWAAVSTACSPHRALSVLGQSERLEGLVSVALYALLYGLALQVVRRIGDVRLLLSALGGVAVLLSFYGLAQFAGFEPFNYRFEGYTFEVRRAFATFGNPTFFAGLLVLALPPLGALAIHARSPRARMAWAFGAVVVAAALFVTFTRGAWLAAAVQVVLGAGVFFRVRGVVAWRELRVPIVVGAVAFAVLLAVSAGAQGELNVFQRLSDVIEQTGSVQERRLLVETATAAARARPLAGYGPDAFLPAFRMHRPDDYSINSSAHSTMNNAHSWPLQYAATLGVPGALLLVGSVVVALGVAARRAFPAIGWRKREVYPDAGSGATSTDPLLPAAWIGCVGFAVHMLTGVAVLGATVPFWILLALVGAPGARRIDLKKAVARVGVAVASTMTVLAVVAGATSLVAADAAYLASRDVFRGLASGDPVELAHSARSLNPLSVKYARGAAEASAARVEFAMTAREPEEVVRSRYESAVREFAWVLRQSPGDYPAHAWLAALQARVGIHLGDETLLRDAQATARRATLLDLHSEQVLALSMGDRSPGAVAAAASVRPLP